LSETLRVLLVEDNPADVDLIRETLPSTGPVAFSIESEPRVSGAVARLARGGIDLILVDLGLPDSQGLETFHRLQKAAPGTPAVVLTGNSDQEAAIIAVRDGAQDYLVKGQVDADRLVRAVRYAVERKRGAEALRQSEERYRSLFEEATEGIGLADANTGEILDCNRAFLQLTGYERAELIGKTHAVLHPSGEVSGAFSHSFVKHRSGRQGAVLPSELVTKSGESRSVEIKGQVLEMNGRQVMQAFFRDVTTEVRYYHERETTLKLLRLLNDPTNTKELIKGLTGCLQEWTGCEAVGIRLQEGPDYPYFETRGFPPEFVKEEGPLCARDESGAPMIDHGGRPVLSCLCGGRDPRQGGPGASVLYGQGKLLDELHDGLAFHGDRDPGLGACPPPVQSRRL